jgi:hypothetical protein
MRRSKAKMLVDRLRAERAERDPILCPLPFRIIQDVEANPNKYAFSIDELTSKKAYYQELANVFLALFNNPVPEMVKKYWHGDQEAAKEYYQERCEHYAIKASVVSIALERALKSIL